jgi:hypothetical protein
MDNCAQDQAGLRQPPEHRGGIGIGPLALLVAATLAPQLLARMAAAAFGLSSLQLWVNIVRAWLAHRRATAPKSSAFVKP